MIKTVHEKSKVTLLANYDKITTENRFNQLINSWLLYEMNFFLTDNY
jgi:hypothetical protein